MKFAIAFTEYYNAAGFNTEHWRKSLDGTQAICHSEVALTVCDESELDIYNHNDPEFLAIINGDEWVEQSELEEI